MVCRLERHTPRLFQRCHVVRAACHLSYRFRYPFTDEAWEESSNHLKTLTIELAGCVLPFEEHSYLPIEHATALSLVGRLIQMCRESGKGEVEGVPVELYSCLKYSVKKNGVARAAADVSRPRA